MLRSIEELNPLFARFGIATNSELLQHEIAAALDKISAYMYTRTKNKLTGIGHASVSFDPEQLPLTHYSQLPAALPIVTVFEGGVSVNGVINMVMWMEMTALFGG